jgi:hypothetical protein
MDTDGHLLNTLLLVSLSLSAGQSCIAVYQDKSYVLTAQLLAIEQNQYGL